MKIALKYGLLITAVVMAWVLIARLLIGVAAESNANLIAFVLFNLTQIIAVYLGMKERKNEFGGELTFKEALKTGMRVSLVYGVASCLFFMIEFLIAGPKLLLSEAGSSDQPLWQIAAVAYAGMFFGALFLGLIYSTLIAFFLARRLRRETTEII